MPVNVEYIIKLRDQVSAKLKNANVQADKLNRKVKQTQGSFNNLGALAARIGGITAVGFLAKSVGQLGINMEQTRIAFATFLGDADKANDLIKELNEFSNVTPFDNAQIIQAGKGLLATGLEADEITTKLKTLGDISAGSGKDLNELVSIFNKVKSGGLIQGEELNQLADAGIVTFKDWAKVLGVQETQIKKLGEQGKISFTDMEKVFANLTGEGGRFFKLMEKQSKSAGGRISTLIGLLQTVGIRLGEALLPAINVFTEFAISVVEGGDALGDLLIVVGAATGIFLALKAATIATIIQTKLLTAVQWALNTAMSANPAGVWIAALIAVGAALALAWRHSETFRGVVLGLWEVLKGFAMGVVSIFRGLGEVIAGALTLDVDKIKVGLESFNEGFSQFGLGAAKNFNKGFAKGVDPTAEVNEGGLTGKGATTGAGAGTGVAGGITPTTGTGSVGAGVSEIKSASPQTFNINIEKLVESLEIKTTNMQESATRIKEAVQEALLTAVTDVSIISE